MKCEVNCAIVITKKTSTQHATTHTTRRRRVLCTFILTHVFLKHHFFLYFL
jgi:hypothetical protein